MIFFEWMLESTFFNRISFRLLLLSLAMKERLSNASGG